MKIAAEFTASEWPTLRSNLEAGDAKAWERGVEILRARLCGRYLNQSRALLSRQYSGFAVLAIDCAVVEALQQFRCGAEETPWKKGIDFFQECLTQTRLGKHFTKPTAELFYNTIRCGILHQAETKADSLVKKKMAAFVVKQSATGKGLTINARRFHEELERAVDDYAEALLSGDVKLRASFITKMKYIAREPNAIAGVV
jgi:hypothetical protein